MPVPVSMSFGLHSSAPSARLLRRRRSPLSGPSTLTCPGAAGDCLSAHRHAISPGRHRHHHGSHEQDLNMWGSFRAHAWMALPVGCQVEFHSGHRSRANTRPGDLSPSGRRSAPEAANLTGISYPFSLSSLRRARPIRWGFRAGPAFALRSVSCA